MQKNDEFEKAADWEDRYQQNSTRWERGEINAALAHWLDNEILVPGRILIPGCGRSPEPLLLANKGFDVTGLDFAPSAIKHQQNQQSNNTQKIVFEQADVLHWQAPNPFDAIYEQTCLCALNPGQWNAYEQQLFAWLRPGGKLLAMFMQTNAEGGPPFHCAMNEMKTLFDDTRWDWSQLSEFASGHSNGKVELGRILTRR